MSRLRGGSVALLLLVLACGGDSSFRDLPGEERRVLVVTRRGDAVSRRVALRYAEARGIPGTHIVAIAAPGREEIDRAAYREKILEPLVDWWKGCPEVEHPTYVVLTPGIPLKIRGSEGLHGDRASLDSELCYLPQAARGLPVNIAGRLRNPYFRPKGPYPPFDAGAHGLVLVSRLAAFRTDEVMALIERGVSPAMAESGRVLLDLREGGNDDGEGWLRAAAREVRALGWKAEIETTAVFVEAADRLIGYASWGSNDAGYRRERSLEFLPRALATTFVSTSARTFREPPPSWRPGRWSEKDLHFEGSPQSLICDLVRAGVAGASGSAYEPYLDGCVRPDILFPAYLSGRSAGESFYLALPYLSWMSVMVGDPLCTARP